MSIRQLPEIKAFQKPSDWIFQPPEDALEAFDATAVSALDGDNTIAIYGQIGLDHQTASDNTERRISAALRSIGKKDVTVNVNSPGGNFFNGLAIYNVLRMHPAKVTVQVIGMAGSAASIIAMAGDEIMMGEGASIMIHNASALVAGNKHDTADATELLGQIDEAMAEVYSARSGAKKADVLAWMDRRRGDGTMFSADAAIKSGLADGHLGAETVKHASRAHKSIPAERVMENALMAASNMSPQQAKAFVADMKSGTRDATDEIAARDAGELAALISGLRSTIST